MATKTRPTDTPIETASRPPEPTAAELALAQVETETTSTVSSELDRPTMEPPRTAAGATATAGAGWITGKHVLMLWQTDAAKNGWFYLDGGIGWKQITQASESAARGMGLLAAGARTGGGVVNVYEGATSGVADAFYMW
jgi:hypothetical protein